MINDQMKEYLSRIHVVEEDVMDEYLSHWTIHSVPKKTIMTWEGETERYRFLIGVQKLYVSICKFCLA
jgi:hypothetical protein